MNDKQQPTDQPQEAADALPTPELYPEDTAALLPHPDAVETAPNGQPSEPPSAEPVFTPVNQGENMAGSNSEKADVLQTLQLHPPRPAVTRLKPRAVGLILVAAAGAVGLALVIGL